jgi:hypothetical protein
VFSHFVRLQRCVDCAVVACRHQLAWVSPSDAVVEWLVIAKQGRQWRHGGMDRGTWLLLDLQAAEVDDAVRSSSPGAAPQGGQEVVVQWQ